MAITAKITRKGQVTVPKQIRKILDSDVVEFEVSGDDILIRPVKSVAGSLASYSAGNQSFKDVRDSVWNEVAREKNR